MLFDPVTLSYLGYTAAALAMLGVTYFYTKNGLPALGLKQEDL